MVPFDEAGIEVGSSKRMTLHKAFEEADVRCQPCNLVFGQGLCHAAKRILTVASPYDELGNHRIVERRNRVALPYT